MSDGRRLRALSTELNTKAPENLRLIVAVDTGPGDTLLYGFGTALLMVCLAWRSEEHTSELQSLMRISYAVFCLKTKKIIMAIIEGTTGAKQRREANTAAT